MSNLTAEPEMKIDYALVLKQLQAELDGIDGRRSALQASIAAIKRLVETKADQPDLIGLDLSEVGRKAVPAIPPGLFEGKTPTQAYRDFAKLWPGNYKAPEIADAFEAGGMEFESRTKLLQAIHSVLKRERARQGRNGHGR